jgi:hypothetical protein
MWILNWLPDVVFHLVLILGLLALVASWMIKVLPVRFIPMAMQYRVPLQMVGVVLTVLGVWYEGGIAKDTEWKAKVAEAEQKVAQAEAKAATQNVKVITKYVDKVKVVKEKGDEVVKYVDREIVKYDTKFAAGGQCEIPKEFITAVNMAAEKPTSKDAKK